RVVPRRPARQPQREVLRAGSYLLRVRLARRQPWRSVGRRVGRAGRRGRLEFPRRAAVRLSRGRGTGGCPHAGGVPSGRSAVVEVEVPREVGGAVRRVQVVPAVPARRVCPHSVPAVPGALGLRGVGVPARLHGGCGRIRPVVRGRVAAAGCTVPEARLTEVKAQMTVKDLQTLFDYGYWANRKLFEVISQLTPEQFTRTVDGKHGSIKNT